VASLLERFYEVNKGKITIDGHDIKDLDPSWLRGRAIGFINQVRLQFEEKTTKKIVFYMKV
jgi:ATP-binding cassette subfamily B (MDR/TAP) protein 8